MIEVDKLNPEGNALTSKRINENINVPEDKREAYERVVLAGKKMMFDKRSNKLMLEAIQGEGSLGMRLGKGIATLILLLFRESQQTIPPSVIVPAGVNLVGEAADFLQKANLEKVKLEGADLS